MKRFIVLFISLFVLSVSSYSQDKKNEIIYLTETFEIDDNNFLTCKILMDSDKCSKIGFMLNSYNTIYQGYIEENEIQNYINLIEFTKNNASSIIENKLDCYTAYSSQFLYYSMILSFSNGASNYGQYAAEKIEKGKYELKIGKQKTELSKEVFFELENYLKTIQNKIREAN